MTTPLPEPALDLDAYFARIAYSGSREPTLETLEALHEAHLAAIPFENLDIQLGRPIRLDLAALDAKLVRGCRGGYCFEQNTLFEAVLTTLGFPVVSFAARVRANATTVRPRTHKLLAVDADGVTHLADVGFGGEGILVPLALRSGAERELGGVAHRIRRDGREWVLESNVGDGWTDLYAFTEEPQLPIDFVLANHFTSTFPSSPFVTGLTAQRATRGRRAILRNRDLVVRVQGRIATEAVRDPAHLLEILDREFGLAFPPGTRFANPEF